MDEGRASKRVTGFGDLGGGLGNSQLGEKIGAHID